MGLEIVNREPLDLPNPPPNELTIRRVLLGPVPDLSVRPESTLRRPREIPLETGSGLR